MPFYLAVSSILEGNPVGMALDGMKERLAKLNNEIASKIDDLKRHEPDTLSMKIDESMLEKFTLRNESQNYMLFADPGVGVRFNIP